MEIGAILMLLAMLLLIGMVVSKPFFDSESYPEDNPSSLHTAEKMRESISDLLVQQEEVLQRLAELENEFRQNKIPIEGYTLARQGFVNQGAMILQRLEQMEIATIPEVEEPLYGNYDQHDARIEEMINEHRKRNLEKMTGFCPKCGKPAQKSDQYCSRCGFKLER